MGYELLLSRGVCPKTVYLGQLNGGGTRQLPRVTRVGSD